MVLPAREAISQLAEKVRCRVSVKRRSLSDLNDVTLPLIIRDSQGRWLLLAKQGNGQYLLQRAEQSTPEVVDETEFSQLWSGEILAVKSRERTRQRFDIRWFIPELLRYKKFATELLLASVVVECLALAAPLFFQLVMDKVLVHSALSTLDVLVLVLMIAAVLEITLKTLRQYLASQTAIRIDARLGGKLYQHLLALPLAWFQARSTGITVTRVNGLNSIREFLTGAASTLVLDLSFSLIFFAVMYFYSPLLTLIVAASVPCYILLSLLITGPLQRQLEQLYRDSALNTAFLTEVLTGIETVKALALEPLLRRRWEQQTRDFVRSDYRVQRLMQLSASLVQVIQRTTLVLVLWAGARLVIDLELSIGQLIAFNMMANHVSQPIIRLTELWREFVQARVSVEQLGDVLNNVCEIQPEQHHLTDPLTGDIRLQQVSFRYAPQQALTIDNLNLHIPAGKMVAFVGRSGSGKSTLTRLIQKLYLPEQGQVLLDGIDLATVDATSLRQRMSIVLQENYLFNRSVRDNIALHDPSAPLDQVVTAAKQAAAHEFIVSLPDGYDTILAEGGHSLSGGQRQRIAIARALMNQPNILIFDEATSALDDESQALIQQQMAQIRQNKTVLIIAHRLSTVVDCDCIYVMDQGRIIEAGSHEQLLQRQGAYWQLWQLQQQALQVSVTEAT